MPSLLIDAPVLDIAKLAKLSAAGQEICAGESQVDAALKRLEAAGLIADAVAFLAHALPKREVVWWGLLCLWDVRRPKVAAFEETIYRALVRWLRQPTEEHRRQVSAAGKAAGMTSLAGHLARAAFVSGGSMTRADLPKVLPPPHSTALIVRKILKAAAAKANPRNPEERLTTFLRVGLEIADEKNRWTP